MCMTIHDGAVLRCECVGVYSCGNTHERGGT
jgi:hypothetical protein